MPVTLYVVRHGETDWNHQRRFQGRLDVPLNGTGVAQGRALAAYFERTDVTRVLTSPLRRARATASMIAETVRCPLEVVEGLSEIDHGEWQGLTAGEIQSRDPAVWAAWKLQPSQTERAGAESIAAVAARVAPVLRRCSQGEDACLVTHGVVSQVIAAALLRLHPDSIFGLAQDNASINVFDIRDAGAAARGLNVTTHLERMAVR